MVKRAQERRRHPLPDQIAAHILETSNIIKKRRDQLQEMMNELMGLACPLRVGDTVRVRYAGKPTEGVITHRRAGRWESSSECILVVALKKKDGSVGARVTDVSFHYAPEFGGWKREDERIRDNPVLVNKGDDNEFR